MKIEKARLADIDVDEISYVDKAANKKKFIFMKRDTGDENGKKGGENLDLLKHLQGNEEVIGSLEGIDGGLERLSKAFDTLLAKPGLTEDQKALIVEKRDELTVISESIQDDFENLFLDKSAKAEDEEEEEDVTEDKDTEDTEEETKDKGKKKDKGVKKSEESEESDSSEKAEDSKESEVKKEDSDEDSEDLTEEEQKIVDEINTGIEDITKAIPEIQKIYSK